MDKLSRTLLAVMLLAIMAMLTAIAKQVGVKPDSADALIITIFVLGALTFMARKNG